MVIEFNILHFWLEYCTASLRFLLAARLTATLQPLNEKMKMIQADDSKASADPGKFLGQTKSIILKGMFFFASKKWHLF